MNLEDAFIYYLVRYEKCSRLGERYKRKDYVDDFFQWTDYHIELDDYMEERIFRRLDLKRCEYMRKNNMTRRYWKEVSIKSLLNGR